MSKRQFNYYENSRVLAMKTIFLNLTFIFIVFCLRAESPSGATTTILKPTTSYEWGQSGSTPAASPASPSVESIVGESFLPKIQAESQKFAEVLTGRDEAEVAKRMLPSVLKSLNPNLGLYLRQRLQPIYDQSFKVQSVAADVPQPPQLAGDLMVSFVPVRTLFTYDDGGNLGRQRLFGPTSVTLTSHLVAVSSDKGKTWKFFEPAERSNIEEALPQAAGKLLIPAKLLEARPE